MGNISNQSFLASVLANMDLYLYLYLPSVLLRYLDLDCTCHQFCRGTCTWIVLAINFAAVLGLVLVLAISFFAVLVLVLVLAIKFPRDWILVLVLAIAYLYPTLSATLYNIYWPLYDSSSLVLYTTYVALTLSIYGQSKVSESRC